MTPMEPVTVTGPNGPVSLHDVFEGRRMLIVYHFMWNKGAPHHKQCEGCTHSQAAMTAAVCAYLAQRDVTYAVFNSGPFEEILAYRDFMGWTTPWYSTADSGHPRRGRPPLLREDRRPGVPDVRNQVARNRSDAPHSAVTGPDAVRPAGDVGGLARDHSARRSGFLVAP